MPQRNNKKELKKVKVSSNHNEDFNTGSHSLSTVRKVGAGYDDTGMGNDLQTSGSAGKKVSSRKEKMKGKVK